VAENRSETGRNIDFNNITILDKATGYTDPAIKDAIEIRFHPNSFNGDLGFSVSRSWYPVTNMIKKYTDAPFQRQARAKQALHSAH
jgi:hypothetical protein